MKHNFYLKSGTIPILTGIDLVKKFKIGDMVTLHYEDDDSVYVVESLQYHIDVMKETEWVDVYVR